MKQNICVALDPTHPVGRPASVVGRSGTRRRRLRARRADLDSWRTKTASVWACADAPARSAGAWLDTVVSKTVARYSTPGDRVLLVAPPAGASSTSDRRLPSPRRPWRRYDGLSESAWAVARLGRSVQTATADVVHEPGEEPSSAGSPSARDAFGLVIVAFDPDGPDRFDPSRWVPTLGSTGNVAVITHSHHLHGRWVDPGPALLSASAHAGLACLDHVILLQVPLRTVAGTTSVPARGVGENHRPAASTVHADLYVFTRDRSTP